MTSKIKKIFALCRDLGMTQEQRRRMVFKISEGTTDNVRELSEKHLDTAIALLAANGTTSAESRMVGRCIYLFRMLGYTHASGKIDQIRVSKFFRPDGHAAVKKTLNQQNKKELATTIKQLEAMLQHEHHDDEQWTNPC